MYCKRKGDSMTEVEAGLLKLVKKQEKQLNLFRQINKSLRLKNTILEKRKRDIIRQYHSEKVSKLEAEKAELKKRVTDYEWADTARRERCC